MLRRSHQDRMSNPSESLVGVDPEEDQNLLDEHERQVCDHEEDLEILSNHHRKYSSRHMGEGQSTFSYSSLNSRPVNHQGFLDQQTKSYQSGLDTLAKKSVPSFAQVADQFDSMNMNSNRSGSYDSMTLNSQRSRHQNFDQRHQRTSDYSTMQSSQSRKLSSRECFEQMRMESMQKAEIDKRKFYAQGNQGYHPQHQGYQPSQYHQQRLPSNNQVWF